MIKCIIVDDEPLAHDLLKTFCERLPHLKVTAQCYDALEAMEWLNSNTADLMFLDLQMPKLKGFDFLRTLRHPPKVIVTTAYKEHALEGFELAVEDYLVKPFSFERFLKAVNKAVAEFPSTGKNQERQNREEALTSSFFVKGDQQYHQVKAEKILYAEARGNYSALFLEGDQELQVHEKISDLEEMLPAPSFMRVHRSFIVSVDKIKSIQGNTITIGKSEVPIGQTYSKIVRDIILKM
ncbi:LytR/AlgR family response regulator transcription factor [Gracilimonas mengyeensis]|uniref:Two component transcriptional regulator, LytTR family n=1 Tax=Gracilimonas mengyeensis TaxID=1302730 RepID=A0A521ESQ5_9BACT|nr:LytTR family DNA-binding domain-containing protein [Gracilimonas mengyeensis]SMO86945.1 two component transcriptional regulator, LytTR family [Gracilimonas mengyeensis]